MTLRGSSGSSARSGSNPSISMCSAIAQISHASPAELMGVYAGEKRMRGGVSEVRGRGNRISEGKVVE